MARKAAPTLAKGQTVRIDFKAKTYTTLNPEDAEECTILQIFPNGHIEVQCAKKKTIVSSLRIIKEGK
jgi:hypothetical protein